ncbi:hypothetical protein CRUP_001250 [Coryphaenoides rupestris]|nr:hypothetical protein CRUP_001250 [Coryphaenoides rupestris]
MSIVTMPASTTSPTQRTRKFLAVWLAPMANQIRRTRPFSLLSSLMEPTLPLNGPKDTSVSSSPSGDIEEGSSVTLSCSSDANPAAQYTWFKEHEDSVEESGQNYTITNITSELGGNYYCQARNAIGRHNSTFLSIHVTKETSQITTTVAIRTAAVFLIIILLLLLFLWMRRKMASRKASGPGPGTVEESLDARPTAASMGR